MGPDGIPTRWWIGRRPATRTACALARSGARSGGHRLARERLRSELVVVGGGFGSAAGDLLLDPAREAARAEAIVPANETLRVVAAELGPESGLVGAGLVAFEALDGVR